MAGEDAAHTANSTQPASHKRLRHPQRRLQRGGRDALELDRLGRHDVAAIDCEQRHRRQRHHRGQVEERAHGDGSFDQQEVDAGVALRSSVYENPIALVTASV